MHKYTKPRAWPEPLNRMIDDVNKLSQRLVAEPSNRDAIMAEVAAAMKTSRQDAEEIMSGYLRQTAGKGHPHGFYVWMGEKLGEASGKRRPDEDAGAGSLSGPDGLQEAAVSKYYRDSGGIQLTVHEVDEQAHNITLGNVRGDSVTYRWTERSDGKGYYFKVLEIKAQGATVLRASWSSP